MDRLTPQKRSLVMSKVRGKDTRPEMLVRSLLYRMGFRFRLHRKGLPGRPDIILPKYRTVVFVHGCFWHRHPGCNRASAPQSNTGFWEAKLAGNVARDARNMEDLARLGWKVIVVWECEMKDIYALSARLRRELEAGAP